MSNKGSRGAPSPQPDVMKIFDEVAQANGRLNFKIPVGGEAAYIRIILTGRCDAALTNESVLLSFNNDTTDANYRNGAHRASTVAHAVSSQDGRLIGLIPAASSTRALAPGQVEILISDPFNNFFEKQALGQTGVRFDIASEMWSEYLEWESTSPIELITLSMNTGAFVRGTRCVAYQHK